MIPGYPNARQIVRDDAIVCAGWRRLILDTDVESAFHGRPKSVSATLTRMLFEEEGPEGWRTFSCVLLVEGEGLWRDGRLKRKVNLDGFSSLFFSLLFRALYEFLGMKEG